MAHARPRSRRHLVAPRRLRSARAASMQSDALAYYLGIGTCSQHLVTRPPHYQYPSRQPACLPACLPAGPCSARSRSRSAATVAHAAFPTYILLHHSGTVTLAREVAIRLARGASQRHTRAIVPALGAGFGFLCYCFTVHRASHSSRGACLPRSRNTVDAILLIITPAVHRVRTKSYRHSCALLLILRLNPAARRNQGMAAAATTGCLLFTLRPTTTT